MWYFTLFAGISASRCTIRSICLILFLALLADAAPHILQPKHNGIAWINPCGVLHVEKTTVRHQANYFLRFLKEELKVTLHEFYKTRGRQKKALPLDHRCMKIDYTKSIKTDLTKSWKEYRMYKTKNPDVIQETPGILVSKLQSASTLEVASREKTRVIRPHLGSAQRTL